MRRTRNIANVNVRIQKNPFSEPEVWIFPVSLPQERDKAPKF